MATQEHVSETMKKHIATRKNAKAIEESVYSLVDSTNIMGADNELALSVLEVLNKHPQQHLLMAFICQTASVLLEMISHSDGRTKDTIALLKLLEDINPGNTGINKAYLGAFAMGVARSHNTLIQSFYRVIQIASHLDNNDSAMDSVQRKRVNSIHYQDASKICSEALLGFLDAASFDTIVDAQSYNHAFTMFPQNHLDFV